MALLAGWWPVGELSVSAMVVNPPNVGVPPARVTFRAPWLASAIIEPVAVASGLPEPVADRAAKIAMSGVLPPACGLAIVEAVSSTVVSGSDVPCPAASAVPVTRRKLCWTKAGTA